MIRIADAAPFSICSLYVDGVVLGFELQDTDGLITDSFKRVNKGQLNNTLAHVVGEAVHRIMDVLVNDHIVDFIYTLFYSFYFFVTKDVFLYGVRESYPFRDQFFIRDVAQSVQHLCMKVL